MALQYVVNPPIYELDPLVTPFKPDWPDFHDSLAIRVSEARALGGAPGGRPDLDPATRAASLHWSKLGFLEFAVCCKAKIKCAQI